jgi:protein-tyrosine phosphatase
MWIRIAKPVDVVEKLISKYGCPFGATRLLLAAALVLVPSGMHAQDSPAATSAGATPAVGAPALSSHGVEGIRNFGQVTPRLYRGAQPAGKGYELLEKMGVDIIVDFRNEKDLIERERQSVEARHIRFISIPWSALHDPRTEEVRRFFEILRENPEKRIFVHCEVGADRTGTMVALYRIAGQGWTADDAVREMKAYHFHSFWFTHLGRYVEKFPQQLASDAALRSVVPTPPTAP